MEFAIFVAGYNPAPGARDPRAEHQWIVDELECVRAADAAGFKYAWVTEHHFLEEYSHLSASEVFIAYALAQTRRIHLGSGIFNLNPAVNHPIRLAERVAMLDHLSEGRFEFGTGRGAGSHEIAGFDVDPATTKQTYLEVVGQFRQMWASHEYTYPEGRAFRTPAQGPLGAFNVLPKPYVHTHPPLWMAAGNPPSYEQAARLGVGVLGFNVATLADMAPLVKTYKDNIAQAEPVGEYVNDNAMVANMLICAEDGGRARRMLTEARLSYKQSLVFRYHDTFPLPSGFPRWPALIPEPTLDDVEDRIEKGFLVCGDPDECLAQLRRHEAMGFDQIAFSIGIGLPQEAQLDSLRLFGEHVLPKLDPDPVHRTTRQREAAGGPLRLTTDG